MSERQSGRVSQPQRAEPEVVKPDDSDAGIMRTGGSIAIATLISRITGFVRTVLVLAMLGGAIASAFQAAYVLPSMIAEVVLGAVLTAIVIPVLVRAENEDEDGGAGFINRIFTLTVVLLGAATVVAVIAAPLLTMLNVGDGEVNRPLTTALAYLLLPEILFYGLSALFIAILNMKGLFKPGAWAPVLNNIVQITTLVLFWAMPGELTIDPVKMSDPKLLVLGVGTTLGVVMQMSILVPFLRKVGVHLKLQWGIDARLRQFGGMAVAIVAYVLVLQVGLVITYRIASHATADGISIYATSWQLLQLPYGVLGVTILTAIMPRLSRNAADNDTDAVVDDMSLATRLTMIALVPTVAFMTFFGPAIGIAIFNFGKFDASTASQLGSVLSWGAFTLIPYAMTLVQLRVFYAREDAWTPTLMVVGITAVKVASSYLGPVLFDDPNLVIRWLALSNGLGYLVGAIVGQVLLRKRLGVSRMAGVARTTVITIAVSAAVAAAVWLVADLTGLSNMATNAGKIGSVAYLAIIAIVVLGVVYLLLTALEIPEMVTISATLTRLLGRFIPALAPAPEPDVAGRDAHTMTVQIPRVTFDDSVPYAGQVDVRRRFDRGTATWQEYSVLSGGAVGETMVIPVVGRPLPPPRPHRPPPPQRGVPPMGPKGNPPAGSPNGPSDERTRVMGGPPRGPRLVPGAGIAGGRYRLLEKEGGTRGLEFWRARDTGLDREVGLTFVDPEQKAPPIRPGERTADEGPQAILNRTRRLGQLHSAGVATVLDVVRSASGGVIVTEWIAGSSLKDVAATSPSAMGAARAVRALAAGAEAAHRAGATLSIDHPDRIRVSADGDAVLAFPAVMPGDDRTGDVRGLGAVLYALLLNRWPLDATTGAHMATTGTTSAPIGGIAPAQPDPENPSRPIAPRAVKADIPFEISAVATRAMEGDSGIRTAATVQHVLDQATVVDLKTDMIPRVKSRQAPVSVAPLSRTRKERLMGEGDKGKRNVALLAGGGLFIVFLVIALVVALTNVFGSSDTTTSDINSILPKDSASSSTEATSGAPAPSATVSLRSVNLFDVSGEATESSPNLSHLISGESPAWRTDAYRGDPAFGGLKSGLGLIFTLGGSKTVSSVTVKTTTPGFDVQLRTSTERQPTSLDATTLVGTGTVNSKSTTLTIDKPSSAPYFIVWLTTLPVGPNGDYQAVISQITVK